MRTTSYSTTGKPYHATLLRESYREEGRVRNRTIANLSRCPKEVVVTLKHILKHGDDLSALISTHDDVKLSQGSSVGAVWLVHEVSRRLGIPAALGSSHQGKLALWQVLARVLDQGSRLSATRLADSTAVGEILGIKRGFNENDLYENLHYLTKQQAKIEQRLFKHRHQTVPPTLFLYDVTSTYLEGAQNELAAFGYNRDGKKGKRQLVVGLLCDKAGDPVSIEVFAGNTSDPNTVASQIKKVARRFNCQTVTMVGDKGMLKSAQIAQLGQQSWYYLTSLTKPQIRSLLKRDVIQLSLFDDQLMEVTEAKQRYILRRNPIRAEQLAQTHTDKEAVLQNLVDVANQYLKEHPRAKVATQIKYLQERCRKLRLPYVTINQQPSSISLSINQTDQEEATRLAGCYVVTTNAPQDQADAATIHDRYGDLQQVEKAFGVMKTRHLELRPVFVRTEESTRGHVFIVMLAYLIIRQLQQAWQTLDVTVPEGLRHLSELCAINVTVKNQTACLKIPQPRHTAAKLLDALDITLPAVLPYQPIKVVTKRKVRQQAIKAS